MIDRRNSGMHAIKSSLCDSSSIKFSIITVVYNGVYYIEDCIRSVLNQDYSNFEYIVVDGGSTDGTLDIIDKYKDKITVFISERDRGIADAFNKGVNAASGDIVHLLNSDDYYFDSRALSLVADSFSKNPNSILICKTLVTNPKRPNRLWTPFLAGLQMEMSIPHPSTFIPLVIYRKHGLYDISLKYAMDYDLMLKLYSSRESFLIADCCTTVMRTGGVSTANFGKAMAEVRTVQSRYLNKFTVFRNYILHTIRYLQIVGMRFLDVFGLGHYASRFFRRRYWR